MIVKKRDGREVEFQKEKIISAIERAMIDVNGAYNGEDLPRDIADKVEKKIEGRKKTSVETIQNYIENYLMQSQYKDVARAYIRYRYKRECARNMTDDFMKAIAEKIDGSNVQNQNANIDEFSFGGRKGEAADEQMKRYALEYIISPMAKANHENNEIYIHDLSAYAVGMHNCLSIPFDKLLAEGFDTKQTDVRPAQCLGTAFQLLAVIFQLQSLQQFGGCSATHLDWTMVPYVRKSFRKHFLDGLMFIEDEEYDKDDWSKDEPIDSEKYRQYSPKATEYALYMTNKEAYQSVEAMYHNLNTLQSRSGNQLPFTSINYGTCTLPEGRMITKALLDVSIEGLGALGRTSVFPCGIFQMMKGVNRAPGDPNYDLYRLALQSTAKRLYPNYANVDWSGNAGYDPKDPTTIFSTMGCRTANGWDINGLKQQKDGRGNICPVTIIMPTLAMEAGRDVEAFMSLLDQKIHEAKEMLIERFNWIASQPWEAARFMYQNGTMAGFDGKDIRSALCHGTLALGQLGLAETLQLLIGKDHTTPEGMELAKRVEQLFKDRCAEFKKEYSLNFGVYYTPAESLCYTALKKFRAKYGVIPNVSDKEFFTNSTHVPVWTRISPFDKIDIESQLTGYSSAGCITYVELDSSAQQNIDALEQIVNYAMDKDIPYFAINVPNDKCLDCGYEGEFNDCCPKCGSKHIQQLRRVTGYLTNDYRTAFNYGKQDEVKHRVKHVNTME